MGEKFEFKCPNCHKKEVFERHNMRLDFAKPMCDPCWAEKEHEKATNERRRKTTVSALSAIRCRVTQAVLRHSGERRSPGEMS